MEQWKDIVEFEGLYEVSNHGQVRSKITKKIKKQTIQSLLHLNPLQMTLM